MREIIFRGKAVNLHNGSKDFVFGQYVQNRNGKMIYSDTWEDGIQKHYVIEGTVGQYTGLTDKNGKKIFEGDICSKFSNYSGKKIYFPIVFEQGLFYAKYSETAGMPLCDICEKVEIIGNIHDNPELLKGGVE